MKGIDYNANGGLELNADGRRAIERRGADITNDEMTLIEIVHRAPNVDPAALQQVFISIMEQYGENALAAVREGYVRFAKPGEGA